MIGFSFWNGIWFLVPILVWNVILTPRLSQDGFRSDHLSPKWILFFENAFRYAVFCFPLLLPLVPGNPLWTAGLVLYIPGTVLYFATWIPLIRAPRSEWSRSLAGILAPHVTPLIPFTGIAFLCQSPLYAAIAAGFTVFHVLAGLYGFGFLRASRPRGPSGKPVLEPSQGLFSAHPRTGKFLSKPQVARRKKKR